MKHLDKVKVFKVAHCWMCGQHFVVDENEVLFTLPSNEVNIDNSYYDTFCPSCENKVRIFSKEYDQLTSIVKSEY